MFFWTNWRVHVRLPYIAIITYIRGVWQVKYFQQQQQNTNCILSSALPPPPPSPSVTDKLFVFFLSFKQAEKFSVFFSSSPTLCQNRETNTNHNASVVYFFSPVVSRCALFRQRSGKKDCQQKWPWLGRNSPVRGRGKRKRGHLHTFSVGTPRPP